MNKWYTQPSPKYNTKDQQKKKLWKLARGPNNKYTQALDMHKALTTNRLLGDYEQADRLKIISHWYVG